MKEKNPYTQEWTRIIDQLATANRGSDYVARWKAEKARADFLEEITRRQKQQILALQAKITLEGIQ